MAGKPCNAGVFTRKQGAKSKSDSTFSRSSANFVRAARGGNVARGGTAIVLTLAFAAWVGVFFAWCAKARVRTDGPFAQPSLTLIGSFFLIVLGPAVAYLYLAHPDWMWHYILDGERVPRLAVVPVVALVGGALFGGYYGGVRVATHFGARPLLPVMGGVGALVLIVLVLLRRRLAGYGGYGDYHAGRALGLGQVKLGYALVALLLGVIGGCLFVGWELYRDSRKLRER